jgi:hypothetical protein
MYEGYGPNGVAVLIECLTDNRNRAAAERFKRPGRGPGEIRRRRWSSVNGRTAGCQEWRQRAAVIPGHVTLDHPSRPSVASTTLSHPPR